MNNKNWKKKIFLATLVFPILADCSGSKTNSRTEALKDAENADSINQQSSRSAESTIAFFLLPSQVEMLRTVLPDSYAGNLYAPINEYMTYRYPLTASIYTENNLLDSFNWLVSSAVLLLNDSSPCVAPVELDEWTKAHQQPAYILCKNPVTKVPSSCKVSPSCLATDEVCLVGCSLGSMDAFTEPTNESSTQLALGSKTGGMMRNPCRFAAGSLEEGQMLMDLCLSGQPKPIQKMPPQAYPGNCSVARPVSPQPIPVSPVIPPYAVPRYPIGLSLDEAVQRAPAAMLPRCAPPVITPFRDNNNRIVPPRAIGPFTIGAANGSRGANSDTGNSSSSNNSSNQNLGSAPSGGNSVPGGGSSGGTPSTSPEPTSTPEVGAACMVAYCTPDPAHRQIEYRGAYDTNHNCQAAGTVPPSHTLKGAGECPVPTPDCTNSADLLLPHGDCPVVAH